MNEKIAIYESSDNFVEGYLNLEVNDDTTSCEDIRKSQGFEKITSLAPFYSHPEDKCLEIIVYRNSEMRIIEIWDWAACLCIFATRTERDFFDLLCKFANLKKNVIFCENMERKFEREEE